MICSALMVELRAILQGLRLAPRMDIPHAHRGNIFDECQRLLNDRIWEVRTKPILQLIDTLANCSLLLQIVLRFTITYPKKKTLPLLALILII